ncbi:hypothetical protein [Natronobiforma cellulositropha]|uniref:hypothetical protein n=1 Tax=Natronobiforma cellulositropha TaxID=1679076 RepID=UPI0021D5C9E4|nr:hypothetical protein [Natronobiforma cellulositropha]
MQRRYLLLLAIPLLALLALGALPGLIGGGDVYYVTASETETVDGVPADENVSETIPAANLSTNRFPYITGALADGTSEAYEEGRFGFEEAFTHTPFEEFGELRVREGAATDGDVAYLEENGTVYRLEITDDPDR